MVKQNEEDDFILTISDNEDGLIESEIEEPNPSSTDFKFKKRKRVHQDNGSDERQKKSKVVPLKDTAEEDNEEKSWVGKEEDDGALDSDFEFNVAETSGIVEDFDGWGEETTNNTETKTGDKKGVDIDAIIARRREKSQTETKKLDSDDMESANEDVEDEFEGFGDDDELLGLDAFGMNATDHLGEEDDDNDDDDDEEENSKEDLSVDGEAENSGSGDDESVASPVAHPDDYGSDTSVDNPEEEDPAEAKRKAAFFAPEEKTNGKKSINPTADSFQAMSLSRPILKGLTTIGFNEPTPIQMKTIPVALLGKDIVGGAVTGSGKTAAFIIPIVERLLYRPKKVPTTRVAILMPTRELAVQCFHVAKKIASFTDITFAQIVGGFSLREQEQVLKSRPDVVIATPGRFIDHMRNSPSFAVDTLEILVLDEADRMLEDGFADELNEILNTIPKSRQTMLFSATMTDSVDKLIRLGLQRPVRLMVDSKNQTVAGLVQEFVRLRPGREDKRLAYLMWLCENSHTSRTIIFFRQKKEAHRVRIIFGLCGLKAAELHGSMTQEQRIRAVESFRSGQVAFLLATDLASRGLDIKNVGTVLNYEAPQSHEIYLHRVGRTARAGRSGRACTLAAEPDRKVVKAAVKAARAQGAKIVSRTVPPAEADRWASRLKHLEDEVQAVLDEEREERALEIAERYVRKGENLVLHEDEIKARPKRTWFESEKQKLAAKLQGKAELNGEAVVKKKEKKRLSNKDKKKLDMRDERNDGRMWKKGKGTSAPKMKGNSKSLKKGHKPRR